MDTAETLPFDGNMTAARFREIVASGCALTLLWCRDIPQRAFFWKWSTRGSSSSEGRSLERRHVDPMVEQGLRGERVYVTYPKKVVARDAVITASQSFMWHDNCQA